MLVNADSHLDEYFADVFALSHKSERGFYVISLKHGRLQWSHCAIIDPIWHQIVNRPPVGISGLKKCVEQDTVECYIAKKYSHPCSDSTHMITAHDNKHFRQNTTEFDIAYINKKLQHNYPARSALLF